MIIAQSVKFLMKSARKFLTSPIVNTNDIKDIEIVLSELLEEFKKQKSLENKSVIGLDTGFEDLNTMTKGFKGGELIIIAARPGMGKTTLCLNFIEKVLRQDKGVVMFSLEMPAAQIMQRMLSAKTSIPLQKILTADLNDNEWERIGDACNYYSKRNYLSMIVVMRLLQM